MTREEAITQLRSIHISDCDLAEALIMAVKALKDIGEISKALDAIAEEERWTYGYDDACQKAGWWACDNDCEHCKWVTCIKMEESEE